MTSVLVFSGVGSVSAETAQVMEKLLGMAHVDAVADRLAEDYDIDLREVIQRVRTKPTTLTALEEIVAQLVVQLGVAQITRSALGPEAEVVAVGHSIGELAAAVVAGFLTPAEAVDAAVCLASVTSTEQGGLVYGNLGPQDQVASLNHVDEDGCDVGAASILGDAAALAADERTTVHTGFPWHAGAYENHEWRPLPSSAGRATAEAQRSTPLALSLLGGFADPDFVLDDAYWARWTHTGVDLVKTLAAVQDRFADKIARVVELSAHPILASSLRRAIPAPVPAPVSLVDREHGLHLDAVRSIVAANAGAGLLHALRDAFPVALDQDATWLESGLGSADLAQGAAKLHRVGAFVGLQPHVLYRHVTPQALIDSVVAPDADAAIRSGADIESAAAQTAVVIRAMSCLLPANIKSPAQLFAFTSTQGDAVRYDAGFDGGKRAAAFLGDLTLDCAKFGLSMSEAKTLDPQQALVLTCVDKLLTEHGIEQLPARTGVYIGAWNSEFEGDRSSVFYPTGTNPSLIAARVSHVYRLHGPCKVINSACASSLEAVLEAQRDIAAGKVDCAIAGGVNLLWDPQFTQCMAQSGFLAPGERCRTFDASADGYVRSEGCGLLLLARKQPDEPFYAEILGGASNQNGGRSASITAPSPIAQEECIGQALLDARVDAAEIDYVECHGTGTKLGDPIEWSALAASIGAQRQAQRPCYLASVKSNLGHLEAAAGVVGLMHAAMILARQEVPHMANFVKANPLLEPCEGLRLADQVNVRPASPLRLAGVSSFGFGGSNVHVILRAAPAESVPLAKAPVAISAKAAAASAGKIFVFDRTLHRQQLAQQLASQQQQQQQVVAPQQQQQQQQQQQLVQPSTVANEAASMQQTVLEQIFWDVVRSVAGEVAPEAQILQSGVDSLGLTELFLRIEQKLAVEASTLSDFLGGGFTWVDLRAKIMQSAKLAPGSVPVPAATPAPVVAQAAATPAPQQQMQSQERQTARAPESEREDAVPEIFTWAAPRFEGLIRTTHVGSLPRPREPEQQYKELHKLIQTQLDIGISVINDGEAGRMDYVTAALTRMTGFEEQNETVAPQPLDLEDLPCIARRFLVRAGLITLNKNVRTCNPHCVGKVTYIGQKALERELQTVQRAMRLCNAGLPGQAFYSAPSPGTLAMFFDNHAPDEYESYEEYLRDVADAMHVEYATIVRHGFVLQVDCPDLAMSRHTRFKRLGLVAWKRIARMHVRMLNRALEGIPREAVRVHVCWGNYSGTHHRDVGANEVLPIAFEIKAGGFGFETANHRHNADAGALLGDDVVIPDGVVLYPGVIDTCSSSVEDPAVVCERICRYARVVGPERVIAGTDCGFSTTAETQGIPGQVALLKLRALVAGARMASRAFNPKVIPSFVLRPARRRFYFAQEPSDELGDVLKPQIAVAGNLETRVVLTGHLDLDQDAPRVAAHVRLFVDIPVTFATDGNPETEAFVDRVKACLADGKLRNSPAFPVDEKTSEPRTEEDMIVRTNGTPRDSYDVVVVGAGVVGLLAAKRLMDAGVDVVVLEKEAFCGGIWTTFANAKSQVNSSEGSYRLVHDYRSRPNRDHSTTAEVRADILKLAEELNAQGRLFTSTCVAHVDRTVDGVEGYTVRLQDGQEIEATGVILAINDRVGTPRPVTWKQHEKFSGMIVDGFGGDAERKQVDWAGKRVVVVGMGAFAVENARTALEHGAKHVVVVARRLGTVCPKYIDYINFVHRASVDDIGDEMNATHNSKNMFLWRQLYAASNSTMPECWLDLIKHTGHTISVSDVWFVGHFLGKLETCVGEIDHFVENGIVLRGSEANDVIEADVVVRCTGFERNASLVPNLTPYRNMNAINYLDENLMYLADAFIDDDAFNSFFGSSVIEMAKFYVMVYLHFFQGNDVSALDHADLAPTVDVQDRKWTDYIRGAEFLVENVPAIREKANALLRSRRDDFVNTQSVKEYIAANRREWKELHDILTQGALDDSCALPYPDWKEL